MTVIWATNSYVQSMGWGPILRTLSHWFHSRLRARLTVFFAPSFVAGHMGSWLLSGWLVSRYGWRVAFWVPAMLMIVPTLTWLIAIRKDP